MIVKTYKPKWEDFKNFYPHLFQKSNRFGLNTGQLAIIISAFLILFNLGEGRMDNALDLISIIALFCLIVYVTIKFGNLLKENERLKKYRDFEVEKIECTVFKVVELSDPEDFGDGYFLKIDENRTLFFMSHIFYEIEFPNYEFEIYLDKNTREILKYEPYGEYVQPSLILDAPSMKEWRSDSFPKNGEIINKNIDEIILERQNKTP